MKKLAFTGLLAVVIWTVIILHDSNSHALKISFAVLAAVAIARTRRWAKAEPVKKPDLDVVELPSRT